MLTESFVTSIRAQPKTANTAIAKDVGIYIHDLYPTPTVKSTFKKSSTHSRCLAVSTTHIFAAQADKAVVHIYSRDRGNQEALISFPERIHSLELVNDGLLALGTSEGRIILWEVNSGRQISTPTSHLQKITCLSSTPQHLVSGSEDSNIHVWSVPNLLAHKSESASQPLRSLSNHRAAITSLAIGHASASTNICVSTSKDNTAVVWNYSSGTLLRTFLLPGTPLCVTLDPCDRAAYVGFEDGNIRSISLFDPTSPINSLYDPALQSTPIQIPATYFTGSPSDLGATYCLDISYDGSVLLSGHESGKLVQWDIGLKKFANELSDLNAPINNINFLPPFAMPTAMKSITVVKPKLGEGNDALSGQFTKRIGPTPFEGICHGHGFPSSLLEEVVSGLGSSQSSALPVVASDSVLSKENEELQKKNAELLELVNAQKVLQKRTYDKYRGTAS